MTICGKSISGRGKKVPKGGNDLVGSRKRYNARVPGSTHSSMGEQRGR